MIGYIKQQLWVPVCIEFNNYPSALKPKQIDIIETFLSNRNRKIIS